MQVSQEPPAHSDPHQGRMLVYDNGDAVLQVDTLNVRMTETAVRRLRELLSSQTDGKFYEDAKNRHAFSVQWKDGQCELVRSRKRQKSCLTTGLGTLALLGLVSQSELGVTIGLMGVAYLVGALLNALPQRLAASLPAERVARLIEEADAFIAETAARQPRYHYRDPFEYYYGTPYPACEEDDDPPQQASNEIDDAMNTLGWILLSDDLADDDVDFFD